MGRDQLATLLREMQWGRVRDCSVPSDEDGQRKEGLRWEVGGGSWRGQAVAAEGLMRKVLR